MRGILPRLSPNWPRLKHRDIGLGVQKLALRLHTAAGRGWKGLEVTSKVQQGLVGSVESGTSISLKS